MNEQIWWYLARATGIVAWGLLSISVITGLLVSTRLAKRHPTPAWLLDLHRFLAGAAVVFTGLHFVGLVADDYVHFGVADVLVPLASSWRPLAVALGVVALYVLAAVELSSLLMRRLPRAVWRMVHVSSFVLFWIATFHFLLAGTDAPNVVAQWTLDVVMAAVVFLSLVRVLAPRRDPRTSKRPERATTVRAGAQPAT